ncbi:hypothetical protein ACFUCV_03250 [Specibacter sp. NPDC057265]|uniref:hypothetical protein n=1 Tax=Specibacter sp. NPDC057265 TaxID=3346075 RepID=UPI00363F0BDC
MDSSMWVWIVIAVIAVIVLVAVLAVVTKRRNAEKVERDKENRVKAEALRDSARTADLDAREKHAMAARTAADAEQAAVKAERMRLESEQQHEAAALAEKRSEEKLAQAQSLDPDARHHRRPADAVAGKHSDAAGASTPAHRETQKQDGPDHLPQEPHVQQVAREGREGRDAVHHEGDGKTK